MDSPAALTAGRYTSGTNQDTVFLEGVYAHFNMGSGTASDDWLNKGTFTVDESEIYKDDVMVDQAGARDDKMDYIRGEEYCIVQAISGCFAENDRSQEQVIFTASHVETKTVKNNDLIDMDILWGYAGSETSVTTEYMNRKYMESRNEDDHGTCIAMCATNTDNDTASIKYNGKTVGWSQPIVYGVMMSMPYWKELEYGSDVTARGATGIGYSEKEDSLVESLGVELNPGVSITADEEVFSDSKKYGAGAETLGAYANTWNDSRDISSKLTFKSFAGKDSLAILAVPVMLYEYTIHVPNQEDQSVICTAQGTPVCTTADVDTYNRVIEEFNNAENVSDNDKLQTIDMDAIYKGAEPGNPRSYKSDYKEISSLKIEVGTNVGSNDAWTTVSTDPSKQTISTAENAGRKTTNGFSAGLKENDSCLINGNLKTYYVNEDTAKTFLDVDGSRCQTWAATDAVNVSYTGLLGKLPEYVAGEHMNEVYSFDANLVKWEPDVEALRSEVKDENGNTVIAGRTIAVAPVVRNVKEPLAVPLDLYVSGETKTIALLEWTNPECEKEDCKPDYYEIYYSESEEGPFSPVVGSDGKTVQIDASKTQYAVQGLKSNTWYYFYLKACRAESGESALSSLAEGKTKGTELDPVITTQPTDCYAKDGDKNAEFLIVAEPGSAGGKISYQWQKYGHTSVGSGWRNLDGHTHNVLNAADFCEYGTIQESDNGNIYRCVVTATSGDKTATIYSKNATLYVTENDSRKDVTLTCSVEEPATMDEKEAILPKGNDLTVNVLAETVDEEGNVVPLSGKETYVLLMDEKGETLVGSEVGTTETDGKVSVTFTNDEYQFDLDTYSVFAVTEMDDDYKRGISEQFFVRVTEEKYNINYVLNGGQNSEGNPVFYTPSMGTITLDAPYRDGYDFTGWYLDAELTQLVSDNKLDVSQKEEDITLYAGWKATEYNITYELNGGTNSEDNPSSYTVEQTVNLKPATKEGYIFCGWSTDAEFTSFIDTISAGSKGDLTLYACWKETPVPTPTPDDDDPIKPNEDGNYEIATYEDLVAAAKMVYDKPEKYAEATFIQTANINCKQQEWTREIGTESYPFNGTYDGNNYYILGLRPTDDVSGVFGVIGEKGLVKDVSVIDFDYATPADYAAGLAKINRGTIDGCGSGVNFKSSVPIFDEDNNQIILSELNSDIRATGAAGGLVVLNEGTIKNSRNNADVTVVAGEEESQSEGLAGGIAAQNLGTILNVYQLGEISGTTFAGGIAGVNSGTIQYGYNSTVVTGKVVGGIVGKSTNTSIQDMFYTNQMSAASGNQEDSDLNVTAMTTDVMKTQEFADTLNTLVEGQDGLRSWTYDASKNEGYPRLENDEAEENVLTSIQRNEIDPGDIDDGDDTDDTDGDKGTSGGSKGSSNGKNSSKGTNARTGDNTPFTVMAMVLFVSLACIVWIMYRKKCCTSDEEK